MISYLYVTFCWVIESARIRLVLHRVHFKKLHEAAQSDNFRTFLLLTYIHLQNSMLVYSAVGRQTQHPKSTPYESHNLVIPSCSCPAPLRPSSNVQLGKRTRSK